MRSLRDAARAVREGQVSPVELVEAVLGAAERWEPRINAFSQLHAEQALEEAKERGDGSLDDPGPLHGVPVAVKDLFDVAGWETTGCCQAYRGHVAETDSAVVRRLREAGAVIVAKTNQHELAAGGTNAVSACGATHNPWDPARLTGGSSGGSAAAVAARVVPMAMGTDTGGSIRIPASFCGVSGLKPAFGRVDMTGVMPLAASLDTAGPLAPAVADVALAFAVIAGRSPVQEAPIDGLRVGVAGGFFAERVDPLVLEAVEETRRALGSVGAISSEVDPGDLSDANEVWDRLAWTEFASAHGHLLRRPDAIYPRTRRLLERGASLTAVEFFRAEAQGRAIVAAFDAALGEVDLLLAPATPFAAPRADAERVDIGDGQMHEVHRGGPAWFTRVVNLVGAAALSIPAGRSPEGLPLGVQLIGRDEDALLRAGIAFQGVTGHHERAPVL